MIIINVMGTIGAGKTTCLNYAKNKIRCSFWQYKNVSFFREPVKKNIFLKWFYLDGRLFTFLIQIYMMIYYFLKVLIAQKKQKTLVINDYGQPLVFTEVLRRGGFLSETKYKSIIGLHKILSDSFLGNCKIYNIYIDLSPAINLERIKKRARKIEKNIDIDYLQQLHAQNKKYLSTQENVVYISANLFNKKELKKEVFNQIKEIYKNGINNKKRVSPKY